MEKAGQVSLPSINSHLPLSVVFFFMCTVLFVCFSVQADPLLGLLGFGGGMDFDSDKAYRWYRDGWAVMINSV